MITGKRKFLLGMVYTLASWAAYTWAPAITDLARTGILQSQVLVLGIVIGGNAVEHLKKQSTTATTVGGKD
jgi:hypothetical protein